MGRPTKLNDTVLRAIVDRLSEGEPLAVICRDEGMPSDRTVRDWMDKDAAVSSAIARARDIGEESIAWRLRDVARGGTGSSGDVQRDKLIIHTDLQLLARWNPRKWSEGVTVRGDREAPLQTETRARYELSDAELLAIAARAEKPDA